jgi:NAD(P)H-flavin reductase
MTTAGLLENPYLPRRAVVDGVADEIAGVRTFRWHLEDPADQAAFRRYRPGQFAQVSVFGAGEFPLSLPASPEEADLLFTVRQVGTCSAALHRLAAGDRFAVRGPYGNGFPMEAYRGRHLVFAAGGIGLIPLRACIVHALAHRADYGRILVFHGARTPRDLMYLPLLEEWQRSGKLECHLTVDRADDGWTGQVGVVGALLSRPDVKLPVDGATAFVCGPPVMFRFAIRDLLALGFQGKDIVSTLERYMKCGVGKCGHCCIGMAYVCTDGPVFTYEQIAQLGEGI